MKNFIQSLPKAELHLHIEGTLEPKLMFELAKKNNISIPYKNIQDVKKAYKFDSLQSFLDIYYAGASVLMTMEDFYKLTMQYLEKCNEQNITHVEIFFDPQTHTSRGIAFRDVVKGITKALNEAEKRFGITFFLIMSFLRHLSQEEAIETLKISLPYRHFIKAVGLDSSELGNPPSKFTQVFQMAKNAGYLCVAHAGEEGNASYIKEALDLLHVQRIDHGFRCEEDMELMKRLKKEQIPLTMCPLSNLKLKVIKRMEEHNIKRLLEYGLLVTVNSDDPAYFGGYLNENYEAIAMSLNLTKEQIKTLTQNSFKASFL
ncbi:MAG: adenosine deaminase [Epsilonproteobacteria bacterium]|nr:adenosine deaminase [Campylobacterota bacterium]